MIINKSAATAFTLGILVIATLNAIAQSYPVKTVRYIVPMSAGSGADTIGRIVATGMTQVFG